MPRAKFDAAFVAGARCEPGRRKTDYYDTVTTGFVLEARASGGKTFYLRYDADGRLRQHKLGAVGDVTFDAARKAAIRLRSQVVLGGDPAAAKAQRRAVPTYAELADQHLAFAKPTLRSWATMDASMRLHLKPRFGRMRIDQITEQEVAQFLAEMVDRPLSPASCERLRVVLSRSFELARRWNLPGSGRNPARGVPRGRINNGRNRMLDPVQMAKLREAVAASSNPQLKYICGLAILCGCRLGELLNARWEHVDLDRRTWLIPTSKNGRSRHVPLSQPAVDLIGALPRFDGCPYLLPNPDTRRPFVTLKSAWRVAITRAGLDGLRLHDLRHVAASLLVSAGIDLYAVGKILGHADYRSTQRYAHLANDRLLAAAEAGAAQLQVDWS